MKLFGIPKRETVNKGPNSIPGIPETSYDSWKPATVIKYKYTTIIYIYKLQGYYYIQIDKRI